MANAYHHRSMSFILLIILGLFSVSGELKAAFSHEPWVPWYTINTQHFSIHFQEGSESDAKNVAKICEQVHIKLSKYFNWVPKKPTQVVIISRSDVANGSATPIPFNTMNLYMTPSDDIGSDYESWLKHLITHEYTHILHLDKASGFIHTLRYFIGRYPFLFPNAWQPVWVIEGLATFNESDPVAQVGRGQSSLFKMFMRNESKNGLKPLTQINLPFRTWPSGMTRYLYGVYFFNFLRDTYGEEKIQHWIENYSNNFIPMFLNRTAKQEFRKDMFSLWKEFEIYLDKVFLPITQEIASKGIIEGDQITSSSYDTGYPQVMPNGDIYYIANDRLAQSRLMLWKKDNNKTTAIADMYGIQFDVHPTQGILRSELDLVRNVNPYYDLYISQLDGSDKTQITHAGRYKYASWHPSGEKILALKITPNKQAMQLLTLKGKVIKTLWTANDNTMITNPLWSPSGDRIVASVWRPDTEWNIEIFNIESGQWHKLTKSRKTESRPKFSADGKYIRFIADYGPTFNYFSINLKTNKIEQLSNVTTGMLAADYSKVDNAVYYMGLNADGFDMYQLDLANHQPLSPDLSESKPIVKSIVKPKAKQNTTQNAKEPSSEINLDVDETISDYNSLRYLAPSLRFPSLDFSDEKSELGIVITGADPIYRHQYALLGSYDFKNNWTTGDLIYVYDRFNPTISLSASRVAVIKRDSDDNPTSIVFDKEAAIELLFPFLKRYKQAIFHLGWVTNSTRERETFIGPKTTVSRTDEIAGIAVTINTSRSYPRAISTSSGTRIRIVAEDNDVVDSAYTGKTYQLDWKQFFPLRGKHVLATRLLVGWGMQSPKPFSLGGYRDDVSFSGIREPLIGSPGKTFNARRYTLRGYKNTAALSNRRLLLFETEFRFPIATIDRNVKWQIPPVGINRIHGRFFYNAGETVLDNFSREELRQGVGIEIISEIVLFYNLPLNLRLGYAYGFSDGGGSQWYATLANSF